MTERRIDSDGRHLGPKPPDLAKMSYDEKQLAGIVEPRIPPPPKDTNGRP